MIAIEMKKRLVGKPIVIDKLDGEAGAKVVEWIIDDNERAKAAREKKKRKKKKADDKG